MKKKTIDELAEIMIAEFAKINGKFDKVNDRLFLLEDKTVLLKERVDAGFSDVNAKLSEHMDMFDWLGTKVVEDHEKRIVTLEKT